MSLPAATYKLLKTVAPEPIVKVHIECMNLYMFLTVRKMGMLLFLSYISLQDHE